MTVTTQHSDNDFQNSTRFSGTWEWCASFQMGSFQQQKADVDGASGNASSLTRTASDALASQRSARTAGLVAFCGQFVKLALPTEESFERPNNINPISVARQPGMICGALALENSRNFCAS